MRWLRSMYFSDYKLNKPHPAPASQQPYQEARLKNYLSSVKDPKDIERLEYGFDFSGRFGFGVVGVGDFHEWEQFLQQRRELKFGEELAQGFDVGLSHFH